MNDQTEVSSVESSTSADHAPLPVAEFSFDNSLVHTTSHAEEWWFVASDVCSALGISNVGQAVSRLETDEVMKRNIISNDVSSSKAITLVSEAGVYEMILTSRKEEAKTFKRWLKKDLLPTLRKEGTYHMALKDVPKEPWTLEEIEVLVDRHLPPIAPPAPPKGDDALFNLLPTRPTAHQKREDARADARARLQAIRAGYGVLRARYPHFESAVKQATLLGSQKYIEQAEQLQEESREFGNWAWTECLRLNLGPEDIPSVRNPSDVFWRIDFAELFKAQFKADWQKYVIEEGASRKAFEPAEDIRYLFKFK